MKIKFAIASAILSFGVAGAAAFACPGHDGAKAKVEEKTGGPTPLHVATASFHVDGMHCEGCADEVHAALAKLDGVVKVDVKLADKRVTVAFDSDKVSADAIAKAMSDAGFKAAAEV